MDGTVNTMSALVNVNLTGNILSPLSRSSPPLLFVAFVCVCVLQSAPTITSLQKRIRRKLEKAVFPQDSIFYETESGLKPALEEIR